MVFRLLHLLKACGAISLRPLGSVMDVRLLQPSKASLPRIFRPAGRVMETRFSQSWNASTSMVVILAGMVTLERVLQPLKQPLLMALTLVGSTTFVRYFAPEKSPLGSSSAWVFMPSFPSTIEMPEMSRAVTRHSSGFFTLLRVTISWSSLRSAPLRAPLTVRSATLNFWSPNCVANLPTESTFTFTLSCAMANIGSAAMRMIISFFIIVRFLFCFI